MDPNWITTDSIDDSFKFTKNFWKNHRNEIENGNFWVDQIKEHRDKPYERLQIAINNLPLPAAFREGITTLRSIIREKKKNNLTFNNELKVLYWLAAIDSFSIPNSETGNCPGYNIMESIPGKIIKSLTFDYDELGYKHLKLLKITDIKWLVSVWGEPSNHTTLHNLYQPLWHEYELKYLIKHPHRTMSTFPSDVKKYNKNQNYFIFNNKHLVISVIFLISIALIIFN